MGYSILQTSLEIPPVESLKRAFRSVRCLTDYDAHTMAADAFGILVKNLCPKDAASLRGALQTEGVPCEIEEDSRLPSLPATKLVRRLDCVPEGLRIYDPLGRSFVVAWPHVMLIACGQVQLQQFTRTERVVPVTRYNGDGHACTVKEIEVRTLEERCADWLLEIVLQRAAIRYTVHASQFDFQYLGERRSGSLENDMSALVRDLCHYAPHAGVNRGAYDIRENQRVSCVYPTRNAFHEEMVWLLWRWNRGGGDTG